MSTQSTAAASERALPGSNADLVLASPTCIRAYNGEYLDIQPARDDAPEHFVTVPISRLRHAFRVHRVQDTRDRRWKVELEPVPLEGATHAKVTEPAPRYALELVENDGVLLELSIPERERFPQPAMNRGPHGKPNPEEELTDLYLDANLISVALEGASKPFPAFSGASEAAYDYIATELGVDPHSDTVDDSSLKRIERPDRIKEEPWKEVIRQLELEIHYRRLCSEYFHAFHEFTQNVFIANMHLVDSIGSLVELEDDVNRTINLAVAGMFNGIANGVGAVPFPGAGIVSGALKLAFEFVLKDRGPNEAELAVAYASLRDEIAKKFNGVITIIQRCKSATFTDWGKLKFIGEALKANGGKNRWPTDDSKMRARAGREFEVSLWKALLRVKWHHMTSSEDPSPHRKYGDDEKQRMEAAHKNYWIEYRPGKISVGFSEYDGFLVNQHWLGYGNTVGRHHEPHEAMLNRLFRAELEISRQEVFTDSWNLERETFFVAPSASPY
jgi:hypothetical protein